MRAAFLPYGCPHIDEADVTAVVDVLRSGWLTTGPKIAEFEGAFAATVGARHAVSFSSGTAALHGAVHAAGIGPGDEVITTPLTFCATANSVLYCGATPVFADVEPMRLSLDPSAVAERITPRTKAIIPVDYAGHPAMLDPLREIADHHGLLLIEDACHAVGATYRDRPVGSISDLSVFSFHPVKHLAAGEGGMVTTERDDIAQHLRRFRNHGIDSDARERLDTATWAYDMVDLGFNYRLTDIGCALGLSQLHRLGENLRRRREIANRYGAALAELPGITPLDEPEDASSAWHIFPVRLDHGKLGVSRDEVFATMRTGNIGVNVHYIPVHLLSYYRQRFGYRGGEYPVAEAAYRELLTIPLFPAMTNVDVDDVLECLHRATDGVVCPQRASSRAENP